MSPKIPFPSETLAALCDSLDLKAPTLIGEGAFKQVYRVQRAEGLAALKVCTAPGHSPRSQREVDILSKCNHPGISRMFDADVFNHGTDAYHYVLEELIDGGTLRDRHGTPGSMPREAALQLLLETTETLRYLRSLGRGFVHRDIKPENIMFRQSATRSVLVDFGIARALGDVSLTHSWLPQGPGTPYFAAPEQLRNEKGQIDWRTDQFALAVTVAVCTLGCHPYQLQGEALWASSTVARVAARQGPTPEFITLASQHGLGLLAAMVQPWSVYRYRFPDQVLKELRGE